jgi:hypothetical protein
LLLQLGVSCVGLCECAVAGVADSELAPTTPVAGREDVAKTLPALMDFYIHPLYVLVSKIISSILNSPAPIHPLYHHLSTLSPVWPTCQFI